MFFSCFSFFFVFFFFCPSSLFKREEAESEAARAEIKAAPTPVKKVAGPARRLWLWDTQADTQVWWWDVCEERDRM